MDAASTYGTQITLAWNFDSTTIDYLLESPQLNSTTVTGTNSSITDLIIGTKYTFTLRARNDTGFSDYSNTVTQTAALAPGSIETVSFIADETNA